MGTIVAFEFLYDQIANATDFAKEVASDVGAFVCGIYKSSPAGIIPNLGDPTGIGAFNKGLWDGLCRESPDGLPDPPVVVGNGGQCAGALYGVDANYTLQEIARDGTPFPPNPGGGFQGNKFGPIRLFVRTVSPGRVELVLSSRDASGAPVEQAIAAVGNDAPSPEGRIYGYSYTATPVAGAPNDCGDQLDFDDYRDPVGREAPVVVTPPGGAPSFTLPIILIRPTANITVPVSVRIGSIPININLGGVEINFGEADGGGFDELDRSTINNTNTVTNNNAIEIENLKEDVEEVKEKQLTLSPTNVNRVVCALGEEAIEAVPVYTVIDGEGNSTASLYQLIANELRLLRQYGEIDCNTARLSSVVLSGNSGDNGLVVFSPAIEPPTIGFLLRIIAFEPGYLRTYKLAGDFTEAGFGNFNLCTSTGAVVGDMVRIFTYQTFLPAMEVSFPVGVRLSLKPGIEYEVYELGYNPG